MKVVEKIVEDKNYTAINLGNLDELMEYSLIHKVNKQKIEGKVFLKEPTNATGTEISFNSLAAKTEQPYFHIHYKNEETYIILKGYGFFQVDGNCFEIKEGSVIRVAPAGIRGIRNDSDETMIYMVVQSKENSLEEYTTDDGERVAFEPKWGNKMNKALLIIDIQNDYFKGGNCELINPQIASFNAKKILERFREKEIPIFHIQHINLRENATYFLPNTNGVLIHEDVKPLENEKVITKNFPNSFLKTSLLEELKKQNIKELIICGMMTHMCIDTTTRAAFDLGFDCKVVYDACCTKDLEFNKNRVLALDVHDSFMASLNGIFSKVLNTSDILEIC